jgi:hypothetical protein
MMGTRYQEWKRSSLKRREEKKATPDATYAIGVALHIKITAE